MRRVRALGRLLHAVLHALHGVAIVLLRFPTLDPAGRHECIRWWARKTLRCLGVELHIEGVPAVGGSLLAANHVSWLDIMAIHAAQPAARFVAKSELRTWPVLARLVGAGSTLYLERERKRDAVRVVGVMAEALRNGQTVAVFPEGTTSDGHGLLPFHANLLQAAIASGAPVQPVALRYADRLHAVSPAIEFIGSTTLLTSLWRTANGDGVRARLVFLAPRQSAGSPRRELAETLRADIAAALGIACASPA